ncbi:YceI family protein [Saccharomonospora iraqiensis]|uniref:YceI family protein n=1 Tax=Saccharomonospora iraqiensis TaxID=52698 RepID=UPI0004059F23|nr:YceI family protein [Saccharomonospora iraqiensis]
MEQCTAQATVSAASFASGIAKRDEHVRSKDYLDAERYPRIVFVGESFDFSDGCGTLHGRLTVKETTQQVTLHVSAVSGDERNLTARATTTIDRFAFGIRTAPGMTGRTLHLDLDLVATR